MTGMSTFVESEHPRNHPTGRSRFSAKENSGPETAVGTTGDDADAGVRFLRLIREMERSGIATREFERVMRASLGLAAEDGVDWPTAENITRAMTLL